MHTSFILSDIMDVVSDGFQAASCLPDSISTLPAVDYLLQSIFLRTTGYQEQKVKCIAWQLATHDYSFRYEFLSPRYIIGEASNLEHKTKVLESIKTQIKKLGDSTPSYTKEIVDPIIDNLKDEYCKIIDNSIFSSLLPGDYVRFKEFLSKVTVRDNGYMIGSMFGGDNLLIKAFESTIHHRNRCAHNLRSYQSNVPTLKELMEDYKGYENYFARIFMMVMTDKIFTEYYRFYHNVT